MYRNQFGVYKIELNGKLYVGSTTHPFKCRWRGHLYALREEKHHSRYLQNAYNKYGESALRFSILEVVRNKEDCIVREQEYIDILKPAYNISPTAGNCLGVKHTEETKQKMSDAKHGKIPWNKGKGLSEETKQKISEAKKGTKLSEETKQKMGIAIRKALTGKKYSEERKRNISKAKKGKKLNISEERRKQISEQMKGNTYGLGRKHTEEFKENLSKRMMGNNNARRYSS